MSLNANEVLVASRARVFLAPTGTTAPATAQETPSAAWIQVGNTTEDSLSFSTEPNFEEVRSHQSDYAVRRFQTTDAATVGVDLLQWNGANLINAFGGGSIIAAGSGWRYTPPSLGNRAEVSALVDAVDQSKVYRFVIPRCQNTEGVDLQLQKGQAATLPLRLAILGGDNTDPWYLLIQDTSAAYAATATGAAVRAIAPLTGAAAGGTQVVITGTGFTGATAVEFGLAPSTWTPVAAGNFTVISDTTIAAKIPARAAGACQVAVTVGGTRYVSGANFFTYV